LWTLVKGSANAKITAVDATSGEIKMSRKKSGFLESIPMLVLLGLLAGAVGGLGIGLIQQKALSSASTSASK
jgi:hypothetical protein